MNRPSRRQMHIPHDWQIISVLVFSFLAIFIITIPSQAKEYNYQRQQQQQQPRQQQQQFMNQQNSEYYQNENHRRANQQHENIINYEQKNTKNHRMQQSQGGQQRSSGRNSYQTMNPDTVIDKTRQICQIYVPTDFVDNYHPISKVQEDQSTKMSIINVCCEGYKKVRSLQGVNCEPKCDDNCPNGYCVAPNECECYDGFVKNDNKDCVFSCPLGCLNGQCYLDGTCVCDPGYKLDETRKFCRPICHSGCGQNKIHNCTEPDVCSCAKGYQLKDICRPTCEPDCGIGGECEEPNVCICKIQEGFSMKDQVCQTDCYQKCVNGYCISTNRCICKPGYIYHEQSTHCVPV